MKYRGFMIIAILWGWQLSAQNIDLYFEPKVAIPKELQLS